MTTGIFLGKDCEIGRDWSSDRCKRQGYRDEDSCLDLPTHSDAIIVNGRKKIRLTSCVFRVKEQDC